MKKYGAADLERQPRIFMEDDEISLPIDKLISSAVR
ncbi:hypothetical protein Ga0466249_001501 [Sporomusaceae bacterium BoRhaA]|nr:hypothetical protein [Pelorhabdus rhamnosifermentans]